MTPRAVTAAACFVIGLALTPPAHGQVLSPDPLPDPVAVRQAAEAGDVRAQVTLGRMYFEGDGVPQDDAEAARWWRLAADQGDRDAQFHISFMYEYGRGVEKDLAEAIRWYQLGAAQGDALAQFNLGRMYYTGQGVMKDFAEAFRWWRLAAAGGDLVAQFNLGRMYQHGEGVDADLVRAYMWLSVATAGSSDEDWVRRLQARDALGMQLSPGDLAEAEALASTCRSSAFTDCADPR